MSDREPGVDLQEPTEPERVIREDAPGSNVAIAGLRLVASLIIPVVGFFVLYWAFDFLRDQEANRVLLVIVALVVGVFGIFGLYLAMDRVVNRLPENVQEAVRPYVFVGPALVLLAVFLVYPALRTIWISFLDASGEEWVGLENYGFVFTDEEMVRSIRNTIGWIIIVPAVSVSIGLLFAWLVDKLRRGEAFAKSMIFLPMAISFVGASIVWRFVYSFRPEGFGEQIGLLNGIWTGLGFEPVSWLLSEPWNNLLLMVIMVWLQTGFAMVILSAAIKAVPDDILEAARIDGATETQVFWRVVFPSIMSSIVVVTTTMVITVMKVFDIVFVMTTGQFGTEVIAERMIRWFFRFGHDGRGAAVAVVLFLAIIPIMLINVRRFRAEEAIR
ncbi:MAG: sugar ABC transporter permease [Acidimicrobiia bacterium]|nr:sugar ABC transporter permease [Acidimicrobiia bacterium]NNL69693.1 sugar ABC transporter permease [Acidimicrobiia bacterium]